MQNLEVKETIQKIKKTKFEIKKELEESIANGKRNENANMLEKVNKCTTNEDAVKVIQEFENVIQNKKPRYRMVSLLSRPNILKV